MSEVAEVPKVAEAEVKPCSNPGCDQPGTKSCSACRSSAYCGSICQTADWPRHREECDGHLRKVGKANLTKAEGFQKQQNWTQTLRYCEIAATKLKQLKDRRLETVELIDKALNYKFEALGMTVRHREGMECIKECYTLWAMNHLRHPGSMRAALGLIESCLHNDEYEDAENYARHAYFMIAEMTDNFIPSDQQPQFLADVSFELARSIYSLAKTGGIPPEEKQKVGEEAIEHARKALELLTQVYGTESAKVANAMGTLADILDYFNNVDDDEVLRLHEQSIDIFRREQGDLSLNVAAYEGNFGNACENRARRALAAKDLDRCIANLEMALPHLRETPRIFTLINLVEKAEEATQNVVRVEKSIREIRNIRAAAAAATKG